MKDRIMMLAVAGGLVLAGFSMTAIGEAEQAAVEETLDASQATSEQALEAAEQAVEAAEEAIEAVEGMGEELQAAGEAIQDAAEALEVAEAVEPAAAEEQAEHAMQETMAAWMLAASPNENHTKLDPFVGQWDVAVQVWMAPGMPPQINQGTSEIKWILDGRFIQENFQSVMQMGPEPQTFKGFGLTGYDNVKQQYVGIWTDTMSTAVVLSTGWYDQSTGGFVFNTDCNDPMTGQPMSMRTVFKMIGEDQALMQAFKPMGGQEFQCLEITYTRKQQ